MKKLISLLALFPIILGCAYAQEQYGNIRGIVVDRDGHPLPGAAIVLESGLYTPLSTVSSDNGLFRLINLPPCLYSLSCALSGFKTYFQKNLDVRVGTKFDLKIIMEQASLQEEVLVIATAPVVDTKKVSTGATFDQVMLQEVPSARDPWVILQQAPGTQIYQENVGGSLSGTQSGITSKGMPASATYWNMDGISIYDMTEWRAAMFFDFDSFEEIQVVTGGQDASITTPGLSVNLVTRRGGNKYQGMTRVFFTNRDLQGDNRSKELIDLNYVGDRISQVMDYGFQLGGPAIKDKFWFWLGFGVQDIRQLTINGHPITSKLYNSNIKLNARLSAKNQAELALYIPRTYQKGRDGGPARPPETTWDQRPNGNIYIKLQDEHSFSSNFLLSLKVSYLRAGYELNPRGGFDTQPGWDRGTGIYSGTTSYTLTTRPQYEATLDGNFFREKLLGGSHEFKFGLLYRYAGSRRYYYNPGDVLKYYSNGIPFAAYVEREENTNYDYDRYDLYLTDSYTTGRLTLDIGLRLERHKSWIVASRVEASRSAPDLLPALTFPAIDPGLVFINLSPRIGLALDLTGDGKTMLRSYWGRLYGFPAPQFTFQLNPAVRAYAGYLWKDLNADDRVTTDELLGYPLQGIIDFGGFDPRDPAKLETPNVIDDNIKMQYIDTLRLGIERELFPNFALGATIGLGQLHHQMWLRLYDKETGIGITQEDYVGPYTGTITTDDGKTYSYEYWTLSRYRPPGYIHENQPDYQWKSSSIEITAAKRLSHRWMMNASVTVQSDRVYYGQKGYTDPTNIKMLDGSRRWGSDWMAKLSFLYQLPWGISFSGFANARQGYIFPERLRVLAPERAKVGLGSYVYIYTAKPGEKRYPDFYNCDLSLSKTIAFRDYGSLVIQVDAFNVFNFDHVLQRFYQVNSDRFNEVEKILNPRVIRFGVRYRF